MILLARRAAENGAQFRWGVLQHKPALFGLESVVQLRGLLKARTYATVTEAAQRARVADRAGAVR